MLKKVFLAAMVSVIMAGAAVSVAPQPAMACKSGCWKAAKAKYPHDWKARHAFRKDCRAHYKAWKKAHKKK